MNIKYIILLNTLVALTGLSCWGAATDKKQLGKDLLKAVKQGDADEVKRLLTAKADVTAINEDGFTALNLAAMYNYTDIVRQLIEAGANVNAQNRFGQTALIQAVNNRNDDMVKLLLDHHADAHLRDYEGNSALTIARSSHKHNPPPGILRKLTKWEPKGG